MVIIEMEIFRKYEQTSGGGVIIRFTCSSKLFFVGKQVIRGFCCCFDI